MLIREIDYNTNEDSEKVFSRLSWAVEKVDGIIGQLANGVTVDTNRAWIGVCDREKMKFELIEPSGYLNPKFIQVIVLGHVIQEGEKTKLNIKLRLGWYPIFVSSFLFIATICMIIMTVLFGDLREIWNLIIWILVFPVLWIFILNRKMNKVEKRVENLFDLS